MTDYIACGKVVPERIADIVGGIADACAEAGCALVGGETAEHPGLLEPDEFDLAGAGTGVVDADAVLGPERVEAGDVVIGLASSGIHANGYSLVRHILRETGLELATHVADFGRTAGEELLTPTKVYARDCLALLETGGVHAFAHITGGGLAANLARSLPPAVDAVLRRDSWTVPAVFQVLQAFGEVPQDSMERTFNMGVGMAAIVAPEASQGVLEVLRKRSVEAWVLGEVVAGAGTVRLV
jgi:phosphoribosylformylglycinamidine cyclo-ligase